MSKIIPVTSRIVPLKDGALLNVMRAGKVFEKIRLGPNVVHAFIIRRDGSYEDLGESHNLLTNTGRDLWAAALGHGAMPNFGNSTGATATGLSGLSGLTASAYKGWRVIVPITGVTTKPVYGNIGDNTTTAITVDQWWNPDDTTGTTPAAASAWTALPTCTPRFMGISADATAPAAADATLTSEQTANGLTRALATYAHTGGTNTFTLQKAYSVTGSVTGLHKIGLFTASNTTAAGVMVFEAALNQDATVGNGDTLTVTDTVTMSGT